LGDTRVTGFRKGDKTSQSTATSTLSEDKIAILDYILNKKWYKLFMDTCQFLATPPDLADLLAIQLPWMIVP
jgi:hypothetical protein